MPSYYVDTGCDNQQRIDNCKSPEAAIKAFTGHWELEECKGHSSYKGWSKVTYYVSPPVEICSVDLCDEEVIDGDTVCHNHEQFECEQCGVKFDLDEQSEREWICKTCNPKATCFICEAAPARDMGIPCCLRCSDTYSDDELIRRDMQRRIAKETE